MFGLIEISVNILAFTSNLNFLRYQPFFQRQPVPEDDDDEEEEQEKEEDQDQDQDDEEEENQDDDDDDEVTSPLIETH